MKRSNLMLISICLSILLTSLTAQANVKLPAVISDNMVLQQQTTAPIWGWADPGEQIEVNASWQGSRKYTAADENGNWKVQIPTPKAGGPFKITVRGNNKVTLNNVLIGEVWVCSGQSNMQWTVSNSNNAEEEIAAADYPNLRMFTVKREIALKPKDDCTGSWELSSPTTAGHFSAAGYFFARHLHKELNVPIGMIHTSWGGTPAESWTSAQSLKTMPDYLDTVKQLAEVGPTGKEINAHTPTSLYNAMIAPLIPYSIKGAIWYQGESNAGRAYQYRTLFPLMITDWRRQWNTGDFPFYFVQIAPYNYGIPPISAELREAQFMTLTLPNTGMAVTMDIGNPKDIHPRNKQDVGKRLALWALAKDYGQKNIAYSGPLYNSMKAQDNTIRLSFDHAEGGLVAKDGPLTYFTIAGEDKQFAEAKAVIDGDTIVVSSDAVANPVAVRYGWTNDAVPNLFNKAGLPASSFRTDNWPGITAPK